MARKRKSVEDDVEAEVVADAENEHFESTEHHIDRLEKMQAEAQAKQEAVQAEETRVAEDLEIKRAGGIIKEGETREQLLDRIRKMREPPAPPETTAFRSEGLQKEFDAEQAAGRAAVAKAQAELDKRNAALQQSEAEGGKK